MWSGSADGCGDGDDDSSIEDWISAYLRDHLENGSRVETHSHGVFIWLLLIGLHVVTVEVQNLGVLRSDDFSIGMRQAVDDLVYTSVNL